MLKAGLVRRPEGQSTMKRHQFISSAFLFVLFLAAQTPQFAQDTSSVSAKTKQDRRMVAISLLRAINTIELTYHARNGSFVVWKAYAHFRDAPEILPGWNLRLNVHPDGQGYDVLLRDMTDDKCGYAALTDENGVIRQSKAIDCEI
jgi:hypothetical protein